MAAHAISTYTPLEVPLPPVPVASYFSEQQSKTLYALPDAIILSIVNNLICCPFLKFTIILNILFIFIILIVEILVNFKIIPEPIAFTLCLPSALLL
jgi:hypothetical protein